MLSDNLTPPLDNPFWQYSLSVYAQPELPHLCLQLQDTWGLNVNLLLLCGWAANQGVQLSSQDFQRLKGAIAPLDQGLTEPLRKLRRSLGEMAIEDEWKADLRNRLLTIELTMEQMQQSTLYREIQKCGAESSIEKAELIEVNLLAYGAIEVVKLEELTNPLKELCKFLL